MPGAASGPGWSDMSCIIVFGAVSYTLLLLGGDLLDFSNPSGALCSLNCLELQGSLRLFRGAFWDCPELPGSVL